MRMPSGACVPTPKDSSKLVGDLRTMVPSLLTSHLVTARAEKESTQYCTWASLAVGALRYNPLLLATRSVHVFCACSLRFRTAGAASEMSGFSWLKSLACGGVCIF